MPSKSNSNRPWNSADDPIDIAAAEWLVLQDHGVDRAQQRDFEHWLQADPRHARAYANLRETWHQLDHVPVHRVPVPPHRGRRTWWIVGALTAAAAAVALGFLRPFPGAALRGVAQHTTPIGGFEQLSLPDGSIVRLNTASEVSVVFSAQERRVLLVRGEASFEVAKDPARPFVVRVGEVDVRAVGTIFNVRQRDRAIEVLVTEGRVRVDDAVSGQNLLTAAQPSAVNVSGGLNEAAPPLLAAGQRAVIVRLPGATPPQTEIAKVAPEETARTLAWHHRQLEFSNEPLGNIAAEFNRYNPHRLVIADGELAAQRFGGKFPADDFASLVRLLETNFNVVVERRENETILRRSDARR